MGNMTSFAEPEVHNVLQNAAGRGRSYDDRTYAENAYKAVLCEK